MLLDSIGNPSRALQPQDYKVNGDLKPDADVALVVGSAKMSEEFISKRQWSLLWRDADMLYQAPRPLTVYENSYILEPKRITWAY
jgi:hypothetical protein